MFCPSCGTPKMHNDKHCPRCGKAYPTSIGGESILGGFIAVCVLLGIVMLVIGAIGNAVGL